MANLHLVTGYKGTAHITSADQGVFNAMVVGTEDYVFTYGRRFEAQIISNNAVRIYDGSLMMNGRQVNLDAGSYLDAIIANGTQGMNRHDIIGIRYEINRTTGVESVSLVVEQGAASSGTPTDPDDKYTESILSNATVRDMKLYRVVVEGLVITKVEPLFQVLAPMADVQHSFYKQNMLINGDFQCNQRGQNVYLLTGRDVGYTVDMWRAYNLEVTVLNEGVTIRNDDDSSNGYFTQFIQLGTLKSIPYTISAMVDDVIRTFTVTPSGTTQEKDFGTFKITVLTTSTWDNTLNGYNNKLKINICPNGANTIVIKYVDVFEGTVAYPHVKEDPATALMRCRRYVQAGGCISPIFHRYSAADSKYQYRLGISFDPMCTTPRLDSCSWLYFDNAGSTQTDDEQDLEIVTVDSNLMHLKTKATAAIMSACTGIRLNYVLSCEHNPNGD